MIPKQRAEELRKYFENLIGKVVSVELQPTKVNPFRSHLQSVRLGKIGDMINPPDKRQREDGKMYTPPCLLLDFTDGKLYLVMEDIETPVIVVGGINIKIGDVILMLRGSK